MATAMNIQNQAAEPGWSFHSVLVDAGAAHTARILR
jgi:hypothetical protein